MKTLVLEAPNRISLIETAFPEAPGPDEALVRVRRIGICGTDIHAFQGNQPFFSYPRVLGHELAVEVVALGPGQESRGIGAGDYCAVNPYMNCAECSACRRGKPNCCLNMKVLGVHTDGGMREQIILPTAKLHKVNSLPLEQLAIVEMLCIGAHAVRRAQLTAGEQVLVIGAGPIGLGVIQFAQLAGANVIAMEVSESRQAFGQQHLGVEGWVDGRSNPVPQIQQLLSGDMPTVVFDATGNPRSMMQAFNNVAHGGTLVFVGLFQGDVTFHDPDFHRRELTLLASRNATDEDFAHVINMLESGTVNVAPWITHRYLPEQLGAEFANMLKPESGVVKAMVEMS